MAGGITGRPGLPPRADPHFALAAYQRSTHPRAEEQERMVSFCPSRVRMLPVTL